MTDITQFISGGSVRLYRHDLPDGLSLGPVVAVDTETMGLDPRRDRLCLVQLSSGDGSAHLVQIIPRPINTSAWTAIRRSLAGAGRIART